MANILFMAKGTFNNNKIRTYYIYGPFYEHDGLSNLAMCIQLSKTLKLCQMPMLMSLILKEKMRTEVKWFDNTS